MPSELLAVLFGLTAAVSWGAGGLFGRTASIALGPYRTALYSQLLGVLVLTLALALGRSWPDLGSPGVLAAVAFGGLAAACNAVASVALYRAFAVGALSVVAPVAASYGGITALLSVLGGERLRPLTVLGLAVTVLGVVLASTGPSTGRATGASAGVGAALLASVGFGVTFWLLGAFVTPTLGSVVPVWLFRLVGPAVLALAALRARAPLGPAPTSGALRGVALLEATNLLALLATSAGSRTGAVSVVTVLGSLFSAVTVLLAWRLLRERLAGAQWSGIGLVLVGVVLVSL